MKPKTMNIQQHQSWNITNLQRDNIGINMIMNPSCIYCSIKINKK